MISCLQEHLGVAVVDDDDIFRDLTCELLSARTRFTPFPAASGDELINLLSHQRIDCIVLDYNLGDDTGFALKVKLDERFKDVPPIIMLTGDGRESTAIKAFRMGVSDYLPKPSLQPRALAAAIAKVVADDRERQSVRAEHRRLVEAAALDLLTGLPGKPHLSERLEQLAALSPAVRRSYAIILIELRQYAVITEQFGLKVSDLAVRAFAKQLKQSARTNDIYGRLEKGVFLIIADVKGDPTLLDLMCSRLQQDMSFSVEAGIAKLKLSACLSGVICNDDAAGTLIGSSLLDRPMTCLAEAKAAGEPFRILHPTSAAPLPEATGRTQAERLPIVSDSLPAADQLRASDRRGESRQRVFKRGIIHVPGTNATFDCTVRNLSANGAGLRIDTPFAVPAPFDLEIVGSGERRTVLVRWQAGVDLGVAYIK